MKDNLTAPESEDLAGVETGAPEEPTFDQILEIIGVPASDTEQISAYREGLERELSSYVASLAQGTHVWGWDKESGWSNDWTVMGSTPDGQVMLRRPTKGSEENKTTGSGEEVVVVAEEDLRRRNYLFNLVNSRLLIQEGEPPTKINELIDRVVIQTVAGRASDLIDEGKQGGGIG